MKSSMKTYSFEGLDFDSYFFLDPFLAFAWYFSYISQTVGGKFFTKSNKLVYFYYFVKRLNSPVLISVLWVNVFPLMITPISSSIIYLVNSCITPRVNFDVDSSWVYLLESSRSDKRFNIYKTQSFDWICGVDFNDFSSSISHPMKTGNLFGFTKPRLQYSK